MTTLAALHREARKRLAEAGVENAGLDARLLVEHLAGTSRAEAIADPCRPVSGVVRDAVTAAVARRIAGEPVHRILGFREFYGLRLSLSPDTLEPRPDTEALVDLALPAIRAVIAESGECAILDLGTGTGAIALALLSQTSRARVTATDIADGALATARANAERLGLAGRFTAVGSDWFEKISGSFDAMVSNPPYISSVEMADLSREVAAHDPHRALHGGKDGLDAYRSIAAGAVPRLKPGGFIAVEIGSRQKESVVNVFAARGFALAEEARDLGGHVRALLFRR